MRRTTRILLAAATLSASATAALATPSIGERLTLGPAKAPTAMGAASIECVLAAEGALTNCKLLTESPTGMGIGEAALKMSHEFKLQGGEPGKVVTIPLRFRLSPEQTGQASEGSAPTP
jgi:hypothetical protein